jgi:hypothetical protein
MKKIVLACVLVILAGLVIVAWPDLKAGVLDGLNS